MQGLLKKADNIELKVKQLKTRLDMLAKENAFYKDENKNLIEKLKQQKGVINELESTFNNKSNTTEQLDATQIAEIKGKIDAHVSEIDHVIDLMRT